MNPDSPEPALRILCRGLAGVSRDVTPAVLLRDGRVAAIGEDALRLPADQETRLEGLWLSPAPLDAHVHLHFRGEPSANRELILKAGVAAVRDLGRHPRDQAWREEPGSLPLVGWAGVGMSAMGPGRYWLSRGFSGPKQFGREAARLVDSGVSVLKVFASGLLDFDHAGGVCHPRVVSREEIAAVVAVGRKAGVPVSVHVNGDLGVLDCIHAGVDSIEHGYFMSKATLGELARSQIAWCPTLAAVEMHALDPEGRHGKATIANLRQIVDSQRKNMRLAEELGVNLVMGSDSGSYCLSHHRALFREAETWLETGLDPKTVFSAFTVRAARLMGLSGLMGEIRTGALGILAAARENPEENPLGLGGPAWRNY